MLDHPYPPLLLSASYGGTRGRANGDIYERFPGLLVLISVRIRTISGVPMPERYMVFS